MGHLKKIFEDIYSPTIVNQLLKDNQNQEELNSHVEIIDVLKIYGQIRMSPCKKCSGAKHQDFPGWVGKITYENNKINNKNIIIIGLEVSSEDSLKEAIKKNYKPLTKSFVHIWYELGFFSDVKSLKQNHDLWKYMDLFLNLEKNLNRIYGTDLAKCFTSYSDLSKTREKCTKNYFFKELGCFTSGNTILILLGKDVKYELKKYLRFLPNHKFLKFLDENSRELESEFNIKPTKYGEYLFELGDFYLRVQNDNLIKGKYIATPHNANQSGIWNKILKKPTSKLRNKLTKYLSDLVNDEKN